MDIPKELTDQSKMKKNVRLLYIISGGLMLFAIITLFIGHDRHSEGYMISLIASMLCAFCADDTKRSFFIYRKLEEIEAKESSNIYNN